ncbi:class I SAM-dependent methyltransferase [Achromobacter spanius]
MDSTSQDDARKARTRHWSVYPVAKAKRIDGYYKSHPTDEHARAVMVDALKSVLPEGRVLDIGCGTGDVTIALHDAGYAMTGLDISDGMLSVFKENAGDRNIPLVIGDIFELEAPAEKFDAATCRYVFSHYPDFGLLLGKIAEYVRPGGYIVFDTFASEAISNASQLLGKPAEEVSTKVFGTLANFSDSDLEAYCASNNLRVVARHASAFFHRNPLFASTSNDIATYDAELAAHTDHAEVRKFMAWFQQSIASKLPSKLSGAVINIVQKLPE